jgi:hypothetical protein
MTLLRRFFLCLIILFGSLGADPFTPRASSAPQSGSIASEHVILFMPSERGSLGRELIADIEHCYEFMNRATNTSLPRKVIIDVNWDQSDANCNWRKGSITIGMNQPGAEGDAKGFLFHSTAREIARLGLLTLSQGAQREDTEFLFEGMIEILVHEFDHSSRCLEAAWIFSQYLDKMKLLGFAAQRSWSSFSGGERCLRNAAPGITFLTTFRELQGRDRPIKVFESLKKSSLFISLSEAFKAPIPELENIWLKTVREYRTTDEITTKAEIAPRLLKTIIAPNAVKPGASFQIRLFIEDRARQLRPNSIFVRDGRTGNLLQVQATIDKKEECFIATVPIEANCPLGQFPYDVTAIDEAGNLRRWSGDYQVVDGSAASSDTTR